MPDTEAKTKVKSVAKKDKAGKKRVDGLKRFFTETKAEFKKIVWPTPKETFNQTLIVFLAILIIGVFIWTVDFLSMQGVNAILQRY
ncbi:MAG TPA: preprotein translocase subunit SecE [Ruminiclostridium sp.]|nr:preprotein translocase subunit SecE [Ruminiclostridium sp.]